MCGGGIQVKAKNGAVAAPTVDGSADNGENGRLHRNRKSRSGSVNTCIMCEFVAKFVYSGHVLIQLVP